MRRAFPIFLLLLVAAPGQAAGLLIPVEKQVPPLAMLNHQVQISIDDQVAITRVEQVFRNHTDRQLEATYIFPVPKGASVRKFSMWVDGKEVQGELVEAKKARAIYTSIVQRTLDPGLLEYMGTDMLRLRVFPVPPKGDQKIMISYTSVAPADNGLVEYIYPLKTDGKAIATLEKFSINVDLKSQHPITNIYSPTHAITVSRPTDRRAVIAFEKEQAILDRDFQLYYSAGGKDVGLTTITHRPSPGNDGHFLLLISPRAELSKEQEVPRDMVFVLDTSGSMRGKRIIQARNALKYCLSNLNSRDRFAILHFATTVNHYSNNLLNATSDNIDQAKKWVEQLEATGGTAINDALMAALDMRPKTDDGRTFTVVFFTDGRPTIGVTNEEQIKKNVQGRNTTSTRIFTFGVGDDVNAAMLDAIAEQSRALSTYVRENEDIEAKVSSLYGKISNPVLANLKLDVGEGVRISEVYPPQLPDLFHGTQLVVLGRYSGQGHVAVKLTGMVGKDKKEFVYEANFADRTSDEKTFVEDLWARRKVGYLLEQIRVNGEKKELVDEVITLAKRYGITTPYTSYLIVPDAPVPVAGGIHREKGASDRPKVAFNLGDGRTAPPPALLKPGAKVKTDPAGKPTTALPSPDSQIKVEDFLKQVHNAPGDAAKIRAGYAQKELEGQNLDEAERLIKEGKKDLKSLDAHTLALLRARAQWNTFNQAQENFRRGDLGGNQVGGQGINYSLEAQNLRYQTRLSQTANRRANNRSVLEVGGVWIDEGFDAKMKTVTVKAMSKAYFRILERHPSMKEVYALGNHLVWVAPNGMALIVDTTAGREELSDAEIDALFTTPKTNQK